MLRRAAAIFVVLLGCFVTAVLASDGRPPFALFLVLVASVLFTQGLIISNANAAAMAPVGHVAGTAAAVLGTAATGGGALLGAVVDRFAGAGVTHLGVGFLVYGMAAAGCIFVLAERPAPSCEAPTLPTPSPGAAQHRAAE
jgi:DHA1 family bicyclomycin/chloramphenicol resistance-like MFS transporter